MPPLADPLIVQAAVMVAVMLTLAEADCAEAVVEVHAAIVAVMKLKNNAFFTVKFLC